MSQSILNSFGYPVLKAEWLLTRKCQLFCDYCEIAHKNVSEIEYLELETIANKFKEFNIFPVIYGGEVSKSRHLFKLLKHMHSIDLDYAIITNGLVSLAELENWIKVAHLKNISVSVDTLNFVEGPDNPNDPEVVRKSRAGYAVLNYTNGLVRDRVTCTTITKNNIEEIPLIVREMSRLGVYTILSMLNQGKPGFRYSAQTEGLMPSQEQIERLVKTLKAMRGKSYMADTKVSYSMVDNMLVTSVTESYIPYLFHDPEAVWDMWVQHAIKADWKCSRFTKFTVDADGTLGCCVDWQGKELGKIKMADVTRENFAEIEKVFMADIQDCHSTTGGCAWSPIKLLEVEQTKGEIGHSMIRHQLPTETLAGLLAND